MKIESAQLIRSYDAPQYLVEPTGDPADTDELDAINSMETSVIETTIAGWGDYNAIVRVNDGHEDRDYLARI